MTIKVLKDAPPRQTIYDITFDEWPEQEETSVVHFHQTSCDDLICVARSDIPELIKALQEIYDESK